MSKTRIAVHGAAGRMGQRLVALGAADPEFRLAAALESANHPALGQDAGMIAGVGTLNVPLSADFPLSAGIEVEVDAVIDFSVPQAAAAILEVCLEKGIPLVVATTGFDEPAEEKLAAAADRIPILRAPNMSLAVNLAMKLCQTAGASLADKDADVEILERHHRFKEDSPSGTAIEFGRIIADAMGQTEHVHGREGWPGARPHDEIGYHAVRVGDNPGEHTIVFAMLGEMIEVTVRATNRDCYALGALAAAKFLAGKPPGTYGMNDVLGL